MKEKINKGYELILGSIFILMLFLTIWQVFTRFVLSDPATFTDESLRFLIIVLVILGSGYATLNDMHFGMELVSNSLKGTAKKLNQLFIQVITLIFNVGVFCYGGYIATTSNMTQISPILGLPLGAIYATFIISGVICSLICLYKIKENIKLKGDY
ncbi:TRAP transporter small permease subunit [Aliivibrio fischeri]|uniref:TRAP transporter small permease n=1 Tax=Aliivibrio fischeri TaxID=668 RepID=UPI0012D99BDB|nr:TRAP transporter small permease [Aliivibrio fischeri]MUK37659.1 TRAP transporter small permease subunit [Aliivibrio fischeri]MUL07735.1 TRAP transporter small permease subunit [Aliivibrio fischeri]